VAAKSHVDKSRAWSTGRNDRSWVFDLVCELTDVKQSEFGFCSSTRSWKILWDMFRVKHGRCRIDIWLADVEDCECKHCYDVSGAYFGREREF
jgi:hypothetical protein